MYIFMNNEMNFYEENNNINNSLNNINNYIYKNNCNIALYIIIKLTYKIIYRMMMQIYERV